MRADRAEVTWDTQNKQWLVRIKIGEEVIRRHSKSAKDADEQTLRDLAVKLAKDEGYQLEPAAVSVASAAHL
ncbi:MAG TPA: hypothetical protein VLX58_10360 [Bryobacteraceae bacterium]|nr:hypothetical protein [Bryobacteraceae bacterium]HUJ21916.1 hypothetical protein [Bryobacteraceae bacterium]